MRFSHSRRTFFALLLLCIVWVVMIANASGQISFPSKINCDSVPFAVKLYENGDTDKAIELFNQILKACPNNTEALYYLGLSYKKNGYLGGMRDAFTRLTQLQNETRGEVYADLAYAYAFKDGKTALGYATQALELGAPPSANLCWAIAESNRVPGNYEVSVKNADLAIAQDKNYTDAYITKYFALRGLAKFNEAASVLEAMLKLPGQESSVWRDELAYLRKFETPEIAPTVAVAAKDPTYTAKEVSKKPVVYSKPEPRYTEPARRADLTGTTMLRVLLTAQGIVADTHIITWLPLGLTDEAVWAAKRIKFTPAVKDGKPVSQWIQIQYDFNLY